MTVQNRIKEAFNKFKPADNKSPSSPKQDLPKHGHPPLGNRPPIDKSGYRDPNQW